MSSAGQTAPSEEEGEDSFRAVALYPRYTPARHPLESFYIPLLSRATSFDRAVGYWSARELAFAAQGVAHFIAREGSMRLIVGAELHQADVNAVLAGKPLEEVLAARMLADPDLEGTKIVQNDHLAVLAWMVKHDRLEIRVGVPVDGDRLLTYAESGRYFHTKYGIFTDSHGNKVAFDGSNNATTSGWVKNHETFDVYPSWIREVWGWNGQAAVEDFERSWGEQPDEGWAIVPLPMAVREHLVAYAPESPPVPLPPQPEPPVAPTEEATEEAWKELVALARAPRRGDYTAVGTAQVEPLPHQARLIDRVVASYPRGYLFADEVGLGKTIEAGLVLRELLLSGRVHRVLLLVPSSVIRQWQEELHEKISLEVPRYTGNGFEDRHGNPVEVPGANPWSALPVVLASSHLARRRSRRRQLLDAGPWDIVVVDEAHHARRRGSKPTDTPNSLLSLLLEMRDRDMWQALYLASATPMQMHPHEAWDLINLLGLPGRWGRSARDFTYYYEQLRRVAGERDWLTLSRLLGDYFSDPKAERDTALEREIQDDLGLVNSYKIIGLDKTPLAPETANSLPPATVTWADAWLRRHTPMRDRVFRNTRQTLRAYQDAGILSPDVIIPVRHVRDEFIELAPAERRLYVRIEEYIRRHYNNYKANAGTQALGFIMTVYRRRLTSSFEAIRCSLRRRLDVLEQGMSLNELLAADDQYDVENALFDPEEFDATADLLRGEISELRLFLAELEKITGEDTKATQLVSDIRAELNTYASVVVFTQYTDTLDYIRERLTTADYHSVGCYSGRGGEVYDPESQTWEPVTRAELRERFRDGGITILLGTDSMSEGLNLQTAGCLINYDMPWNLMRVEQRIGRIDRVGARYRDIRIINYFYADTVEQRVYEGIAGDYSDFTDIVGNAQPVLGTVEKAIEQLALADAASQDDDTDDTLREIRNDLASLADQPVQSSDFGDTPEVIGRIDRPPALVGSVTLADLETILTANQLTRDRFSPADGHPGAYQLSLPKGDQTPVSFRYTASPSNPGDYGLTELAGTALVTFRREVAEAGHEELPLLTFGSPHLTALLPSPEARDSSTPLSFPPTGGRPVSGGWPAVVGEAPGLCYRRPRTETSE
ncbi:MAG TPA: helicase-related protein [Streptosporangiaceae bacterium]|jgi:SNF2 family DNA or RNA helicase